MNHWAAMLHDAPALLQRLIARTQRISLPRGVSPDLRALRLRRAICRSAAVRATYATLEPGAQAALQVLRCTRGGLPPAELERRFGPIRSLHQITADPQPRTVAERLLLLGWLLPRPPSPHHPPRYLLPPELRHWLPRPLMLADHGPAPDSPQPPAPRAAAALLVAAAEAPLRLRANGDLTSAAARRISERLGLLEADGAPLARFLLPLLVSIGTLAQHRDTVTLAHAGERFLAETPEAQLAALRDAWPASPAPDQWLRDVAPASAGIDWPLLRRRLCSWIDVLPRGRLLDASTLYDALAATLGPLADTQTHGFRPVDRAPWQRQRAAAVLDAALRGPLAWLGYVAWLDGEHPLVYRPEPASSCSMDQRQPAWRYGAAGTVVVPHAAVDQRVLDLLTYAHWAHADAHAATYHITPATLTRAHSRGQSEQSLILLLEHATGAPLPSGWGDDLRASTALRLEQTAVLLADQPNALSRACRSRTVRRLVRARPAPGVALVDLDKLAPLQRALERSGIPCSAPAPAVPAPAGVIGLSPADCATLLVALEHYRRDHGSQTQAAVELTSRLQHALPAELRSATLAALRQQDARDPAAVSPPRQAAHSDALAVLRQALRQHRPVGIVYDTGGEGVWRERVVRPTELEQRGGIWYLHAFCTDRQADRVFRVDRIGTVSIDAVPHAPPDVRELAYSGAGTPPTR